MAPFIRLPGWTAGVDRRFQAQPAGRLLAPVGSAEPAAPLNKAPNGRPYSLCKPNIHVRDPARLPPQVPARDERLVVGRSTQPTV